MVNKAFELADKLERVAPKPLGDKAAAELRRLHGELKAREDDCETHSAAVYEATKLLAEAREQRDQLLQALKKHVVVHDEDCLCGDCAAIKQAEGAQE